jgi:hypothetical protein
VSLHYKFGWGVAHFAPDLGSGAPCAGWQAQENCCRSQKCQRYTQKQLFIALGPIVPSWEITGCARLNSGKPH